VTAVDLYRHTYPHRNTPGEPNERDEELCDGKHEDFRTPESIMPLLLKATESWQVVRDMTLSIEEQRGAWMRDGRWQAISRRPKRLLDMDDNA
jgi:hypothetical protein